MPAATGGALAGIGSAIGNKDFDASTKPPASGGGGAGVGQGSVTAPALASVPSVLEQPMLWITVGIGAFTWPLKKGQGTANVKVKSRQKLDEQKASGKAKAKLKQSGVESCPVEIDLVWLSQHWTTVESMLNAIDPNGPSAGGPFEISHPEATRRNVKSVMIREIGDIVTAPGGWKQSTKITAVEWVIPAKAAAGVGTKTPKKADQWVATGNKGTPIDASGNSTWVATGNAGTGIDSSGFSGPNAPDASP